MCYSVFIVDDHPIFVEGLRGVIERQAGFKLAGSASDAATAKDRIASAPLDLVTLDLALPDGSGFDLIQYAKAVRPYLRILVVSGLDKSLYASRALRMGAHGFLSKRMAPTKVVEAMRAVASGDVYLDADLTQKLLAEQVGHQDAPAHPLEALTDRELDVYRLIGSGLTVQEIAAHLHLSPKTIETYRTNVKRKLGVSNSRQLVRDATIWCLAGAWTDPPKRSAA